MRFDDLIAQSKRAIGTAGPRYTPGVDPAAPNLRVAHLVDAVQALSMSDKFRERVREQEKDLRDALRYSQSTIVPLFRRRVVTPEAVAKDLAQLSSLETPQEIRQRVLKIRRRCGLLTNRIQRELETIYQSRNLIAEHDLQARERLDSSRRDLILIDRAVEGIVGYLSGLPGTLLADRTAFLILGSWGTGKTHFMCDIARTALANQTPALLALASSLDPQLHPLDGLADATGLAKSGEELLRQLDTLGASRRRRSLILIDGINEGDRSLWRSTAASIVRRVREYNNVALVLTCRTPFDRTIFDDRTRSLFAESVHYGFEDQEFDAQVEFFSHYSIPAPQLPLIVPEFSRPLFLKILCESLAKLSRGSRGRKLRQISSGQKGMTYVLEYFAKKIGADIEQHFGLPRKSFWNILKGNLGAGRPGVAGLMAAQSHDWILPASALAEIQAHTGRNAATARAILDRLVADGLLSESVANVNGQWLEVITFPYQRFGDHIVARHLMDTHLNISSEQTIRRCFYRNRPLGKLFVLDQWRRGFQEPGLAAAVMLEFPERMKRTKFDRELLWYLPESRRLVIPVKDVFLEGLYWRGSDSFTKETDQMIDFLLDFDDDQVRSETLEVLAALAARPEHPYNASTFTARLLGMALVDRDLVWTEYIRTWGDLSALRRVLAWIERRHIGRIPRSVAENDMKLLSVGLTTTDRTLRDRLTRAIAQIGLQHPESLFDLVLGSLRANDPYIPERMLAAAYSVSMRLWADPMGQALRRAIVPFARELVREMFLPDSPHGTYHTLMRGYALGVIHLCRKMAPNAIATQHVHFLGQGMGRLKSPFHPTAQIDAAGIENATHAMHMDFENYTIGRLIPNRANYDDNHPEYVEVRKQILDRVRDLGYDWARFEAIDGSIARENWRETDSGRTDRYGKKYSWIAYFEMYGVREERMLLPEQRQGERTPDCDVEPSFPGPPKHWKPRLPRLFQNSPTEPAAWLVSGLTPDYMPLLRRRTVDRQIGPWILLDGYVTQAGSHDREVSTFLRSFLLAKKHLDHFAEQAEQEDYLTNHSIPEPPGDFYTYMGEIPWSTRYAPELRNTSGDARRQTDRGFPRYENGRWTGIPVEIPVRRWAWESYHSELTQISSVVFPAPAICESLGLVNTNCSPDLRDSRGRVATLGREWPNERDGVFASQANYIREELIREYLEETAQQLVWITWGERTLHYELLSHTTNPEIHSARANHLNYFAELHVLEP